MSESKARQNAQQRANRAVTGPSLVSAPDMPHGAPVRHSRRDWLDRMERLDWAARQLIRPNPTRTKG